MRLLMILVILLLVTRSLAEDYETQQLSTNPDEQAFPTALNDYGAVTGYSFRPADQRIRSWIWSGGAFRFLPEKINTQNSTAFSINNLEQVAGTTTDRSRDRGRAFFWQN